MEEKNRRNAVGLVGKKTRRNADGCLKNIVVTQQDFMNKYEKHRRNAVGFFEKYRRIAVGSFDKNPTALRRVF